MQIKFEGEMMDLDELTGEITYVSPEHGETLVTIAHSTLISPWCGAESLDELSVLEQAEKLKKDSRCRQSDAEEGEEDFPPYVEKFVGEYPFDHYKK